MPSPPPLFNRVLVLGLGLLGGSFALALAAAGGAGRVWGYDTHPDHLREALALGLVQEAWDPAGVPEPFDLIFLAMPPGQTAAATAGLGPWLAPDGLLTDACSVKVSVIQAVRATLGFLPGFLPAHPIAGSHLGGPSAARADLFCARTVVLCPLAETSAGALARGRALWAALGARTVDLDPQEHDATLALLSHLPHLLAFACAGQARDADADLGLAGTAFGDFTRIAMCPPDLWADIFLENRAALLGCLQAFRERLGGLETALAAGDRAALTETLARAGQWRAASR